MIFYWKLQWTRTKRFLKELGISPFCAILITIILTIALIKVLYIKTIYAPYIIILALISFLIPLSEKRRNSFLKINFSFQDFYKIRLIENLIIAVPFALVMSIIQWHFINILPIIIAAVMSHTTSKSLVNKALPTPFSKRPFEVVVGFRTSGIILMIQLIIFSIGLYVNNYNLSAVLYISLFLTIFSFYNKMENIFYLWSHTMSPTTFINSKIITAIIQTTKIIILPITLLLLIHPTYWRLSILLTALGFCYVTLAVVLKYAIYPNVPKITTIISIVASITLPFFLIMTIPYYYRAALSNLKIELL